MSVTKPTGTVATSSLVSFGVDPTDSTQQGQGVGVYSAIFCFKSGGTTGDDFWAANIVSNCGLTSAATATPASVADDTAGVVQDVMNSIEIGWTVPFAIPNDRTEAYVVCAVNGIVAATTVTTRFNNDPMKILSSSFMAKNMGTANCYYDGVLNTDAEAGNHQFRCVNIGAITSGTELKIAFQFSINNQDKSIAMGATGTNSVTTVHTSLTCTLKVNTWTSDTASSTEWLSQAYTTVVDGVGQTSKFGEWTSFFATQSTLANPGQFGDTYAQAADNQSVEVWLLMAVGDSMAADTAGKREFPFTAVADTSATQLNIRAYGSGLKSGSTLTLAAGATYPAVDGDSAICQVHSGTRDDCIAIAIGVTDKAAESSGVPSGMVGFQLGNNAWGGSCCVTANNCQGGAASNIQTSCDKPASAGNTNIFMAYSDGGDYTPVHAKLAAASALGNLQSVTTVKMTNLLLMPAYLTTFRGRGGWGTGDSNQKLVDVFWQMVPTTASSPAMQLLLHFYVSLGTALADGTASGVTMGYPLNSYATIDAAMTTEGSNDGSEVLATGVKFFIVATETPVQSHVAVFTLRMTPFYKSTGGNEVEVVVQGSRTVSCWVYSSQTGGGYCTKFSAGANTYFQNNLAIYREQKMFAGMGLLVCDIGVAAGATGGETIFVPATQQAHAAVGAQFLPGLGTEDTGTAGLATHPMNTFTGAVACSNDGSGDQAMRLMFGTDKDMANMLSMGDGASHNMDVITQTDNVVGTTGNTFTTWYSATTPAQYNDNTAHDSSNAASPAEYDMDAVTAANWVYGGTGIATTLTWRQAAAQTYNLPRDAMVVCTDVTGAAIPSTVAMTATDANGAACTAVFVYSYLPTATTRAHRQCRWCSATFTTPNVVLHLADYTPPLAPTRVISGVSIWGVESTTGHNSYFTDKATATMHKLDPTAATTGTCGSNPPKIAASTNAQSVAFTFKSPVALASGQTVIWEETTSPAMNWKITAIPANSVSCTCAGHSTWTQAQSNGFTRISATRFQLTIPDLAATDSELTCTAGNVVCTVRGWNSGAAPANDMTATCFACDAASGSDDCTTSEAVTGQSGQAVVSYHADATVTYQQDGTQVTTVLSIKDVAFVPNSKNARGRLTYKPKDFTALYGSESTIAYTFGGQTFGAGAMCQIFAEDSNNRGFPGMIMASSAVSNCVISGGTVTLTLTGTTANFHVAIIAMDAWLASDSNKVTGQQNNFGASVRTTTGTTDDQYQMVTLTAYGSNKSKMKGLYSNTPTVGEIEVTRSLTNIMDLGMIQFKVTVKGTYSVDADSYLCITFPTYYNPGVGNWNMPRCAWRDAENTADAETVFCMPCWDW
jgi:hypothetical protein